MKKVLIIGGIESLSIEEKVKLYTIMGDNEQSFEVISSLDAEVHMRESIKNLDESFKKLSEASLITRMRIDDFNYSTIERPIIDKQEKRLRNKYHNRSKW